MTDDDETERECNRCLQWTPDRCPECEAPICVWCFDTHCYVVHPEDE